MGTGQRVIVRLDPRRRDARLVENWSGLHATVTGHRSAYHVELLVDDSPPPPSGSLTIVVWTHEVIPETVDIEEDPVPL